MSFSTQDVDATTIVVRVGPTLDYRTAPQFKDVCRGKIGSGIRRIVLDFSKTGVLDSTGVGSVFSVYRQINAVGGEVVFAAISRPVRVIVQLTRIYKVFRLFPTVESAVQPA